MTRKFIVSTLTISSVYIIFTIYMMNGELVKNTLLGNFPLDYKFDLMIALLQGMWTAMSGAGLFILFAIALLTGINLVLVFQRLSLLRSAGKLHLVVGGSSVLGFIGSGCAACGLPILAILGLSGSIAYLPFRGMELSYLSIFLLLVSLFFLTKKINEAKSCRLNIQAGSEGA